MDVDECITAYNNIIKKVFGEKLNKLPINWKGDIKPQFDSIILENAIKAVVASCGIPEATLLNDGVVRGCRVYVSREHEKERADKVLASYALRHMKPKEPDV